MFCSEFYDYPVTSRPRQPLGCWEYYPETSMPHPQPCPTDGTYRCPKCAEVKSRYRIKLLLWDPSESILPENCKIREEDVITDIEPAKWLLSYNAQGYLDSYNATRPSTLGPLAVKDMKMRLAVERLNTF